MKWRLLILTLGLVLLATLVLAAEYGEGDTEATVDWAWADSCEGTNCDGGVYFEVDDEVEVTSDVDTNDGITANTAANLSSDAYLLSNWTNSFSVSSITEVLVEYEYEGFDSDSPTENYDVRFYWWNGSTWQNVDSDIAFDGGTTRTITVNLTSDVDTQSELNDIKMNATVEFNSGGVLGVGAVQFDYVGLNLSITESGGNTAPSVSSVSLTPASPVSNEDLNCSFTITDPDAGDTLTANVTWINGSTEVLSTTVNVANNTENSTLLGSGNTTAGDTWKCKVTPNDGTTDGTASESSGVSISASATCTFYGTGTEAATVDSAVASRCSGGAPCGLGDLGTVTSSVDTEDGTYADISMLQSDTATSNGTLNANWTNEFASGTVDNITLRYARRMGGSGQGNLTIYWHNGTAWESVCQETVTSTTSANRSCDLTSRVNTPEEANDIRLRFEAWGPTGTSFNPDAQTIDFDYVGLNITFCADDVPQAENITLVGNESTSRVNEDLNCSATLYDPVGGALNVTVDWYKDDALFLSEDFNNSYANGTLFNATLGVGNTTVGSHWVCGLTVHNGTNSSTINSSQLGITNYPTTLSVFDEEQDDETEAQSNDASVRTNEWTRFYANYSSSEHDASQVHWHSSDIGSQGYAVRAIDADDDGRRDELVFPTWGTVDAYDVTGTRLWRSSNNSYDNTMEMHVADLTGNGQDEVAILAEGGKLHVLNGTDGSQLWASDTIGSGYRGTFALGYGDVDGDGNQDDLIAAGDEIGGTWGIAVYIYNESSSQFENLWNASDTGGEQVYEIDVVELSGKENLVGIVTENGGQAIVYHGNGTKKWETGDLGRTDALAFVDLDSDGDEDEVVVAEQNSMIYLNSDGTTNQTITTVYAYEREVIPYDNDSDGTNDGVLIGDWGHQIRAYDYSGSLRWYTRMPLRDFETWWFAGDFYSMILADVNNDGRDELIAGQDPPSYFILDTSDGSILGRYYFGWKEWPRSDDYGMGNAWGNAIGLDIVEDVNGDAIIDIVHARGEGYTGFTQEGSCTITIDGQLNYMWFNETSSLWEYRYRFNDTDRTQLSNATYNWSVNCSKSGYASQSSGTKNITIDVANATLDSFDVEDDAEDKAGWLEEEPANTNEQLHFFANYTVSGGAPLTGIGFDDAWAQAPERAYTVAFADTDGDGQDDVLAQGGYEDLYVYHLNGTLNWSTQDTSLDTIDVHAMDLDGDGVEELGVVGSGGYFKLYNATSGAELFSAGAYGVAQTATMGDVDGDGLNDAVVGFSNITGSDGFIVFHYNDTAEQYEELFNVSDMSNYATEFSVAELDGRQNLVAAVDLGPDEVRVYYANGSLAWTTGDLGSDAWSAQWMDYDQDGEADELLCGGPGDNYIYNETGGLLDTHTLTTHPVTDYLPYDYDNDGFADEYVQFEQWVLKMVDTDGTELWSKPLGANSAGSLQRADLNHDGRDEILFLGAHDAAFRAYNATGGLQAEASVMRPSTIGENQIAQTGAGESDRGWGRGIDVGRGVDADYIAVGAYHAGSVIHEVLPRCTIRFNDSVTATMRYNASAALYYYNRSFATVGDYDWNVTCISPEHVTRSSGTENITVHQGCAILTSDTTLTADVDFEEGLTGSFTGAACFIIEANDVTLDCKGYMIEGNETFSNRFGVYTDSNNTSVQNCDFKYMTRAFYTQDNHSALTNATIEDAEVRLEQQHHRINNVTLTPNRTTAGTGIAIYSDNTTLTEISTTAYDIAVNGVDTRLTDVSLANESRIEGQTDASSVSVQGVRGQGQLLFGDTDNVNITCRGTLQGTGSSTGISLSADSRVEHCLINNHNYGLRFDDTDSGRGPYINNVTMRNVSTGLEMRDSFRGVVKNVEINYSNTGIQLEHRSDNNNFTNVTLVGETGSSYGIRLEPRSWVKTFDSGKFEIDRTVYDSPNNTRMTNFSIDAADGDGINATLHDWQQTEQQSTLRNKIFVDCKGRSISGSGNNGILMYGLTLSNATIRNCSITGFNTGILLSSSMRYGLIENVSVTDAQTGINLIGTSSDPVNTIIDSSFCGSSVVDANDDDSNEWYNNTCNTTSGGADCKYFCTGSLDNELPSVANVSITNVNPLDTEQLNCNVTVTDADPFDSLKANITWYNGTTAVHTDQISLNNNTPGTATLDAGNLSEGEVWTCEATPYDGYEYGTAANSSGVEIWQNVTGCGSITTNARLTQHVSSPGADCFTLDTSDITFECDNYNITGDDTAATEGISSSSQSNLTIQNCNIEDFTVAVFLTSVSQSRLTNITTKSNLRGLRYSGCTGNNVTNYISDQDTAVSVLIFGGSQDNNFTNLDLTADAAVDKNIIRLGNGVNTGNRFVDLNIDGTAATGHAILQKQDVSTNSDNYYDCQGGTIQGGDDVGVHGILWNQDGNTIGNCTIQDWDAAVYLNSSATNARLNSLTLSSSRHGIYDEAGGISATDITVNTPSVAGLRLASNDNVTGLNISLAGTINAIESASSADNTYIDCENGTIDGNDALNSHGIDIDYATNTNWTVRNCTITDFDTGIFVEGDDHSIVDNNVSSATDIGINITPDTSTGSTIENNYFCGSGTVDASDDDQNTWTNNRCDNRIGWAWCDYDCGDTANVNTPPTVQSVTLTPDPAYHSETLNCTFNITDPDTDDVLYANVTWYEDGVSDTQEVVSVTNATLAWSTRTGTAGSNYTCEVLPYDQVNNGTPVNSSEVAVYQGCGNLNSDLTLVKDLTTSADYCFQVLGDDIVIDCAGYTLSGPDGGSNAIITYGTRDNVTVRNCRIEQWATGVNFTSDTNSLVENTSFYSQSAHATYTDGSGNTFRNLTLDSTSAITLEGDSNTVRDILESGTSYVVSMDGASYNTVENVTSQGSPFNIVSSNYNTFANITISTLAGTLSLSQIPGSSNNNTLTNLVMDGVNTEIDVEGGENHSITCASGTTGDVIIQNTDNFVLRDCNITRTSSGAPATLTLDTGTGAYSATLENIYLNADNGQAMYIAQMQSGTVTNMTIVNAKPGIELLDDSSSNTFTDVSIETDCNDGDGDTCPALLFSTWSGGRAVADNTFTGLTIDAENGTGILFDDRIAENTGSNTIDCQGETLQGNDNTGSYGVHIDRFDSVTIYNCTIIDFDEGIRVGDTESDNHNISYNNVSSSVSYGIRIDSAVHTGSTIEQNYFCDSGTTDANDQDSNTWETNSCNTTSGNARCSYYCDGTPQQNPALSKLAIRNAVGSVVASLDKDGYLFLTGTLSENQGSVTPTSNSLVIRDSSETPVAYFDDSGNLILAGSLTEYGSPARGSSDLVLRNTTSDVAVLSDTGNLVLLGEVYENYPNP